jgi:hypothetical protein
MRVKFPEWHTRARDLRANGMPVIQIVRLLNDAGIDVSASRVSQVTSLGWEERAERDKVRLAARDKEVWAAKKEGRDPDPNVVKAAMKKYHEEKAKMHRSFEMVPATDPTDVYHRLRIRCGQEGCNHTLIFTRRGAINPVQASKWFVDKGWVVGNSDKNDRCPDHRSKKTATLPVDDGVRPIAKPVEQKIPYQLPSLTQQELAKIAEAGPTTLSKSVDLKVKSEPTRTDKRLIRLKLEEVYGDEDSGYREGWDDARVAADLNISKEWVAAVREEDFGSEHGNQLAILITDIDAKIADMQGSMTHIEGLVRHSDKLWEELDAKLDAYDIAKAELATMIMEFSKKKTEKL